MLLSGVLLSQRERHHWAALGCVFVMVPLSLVVPLVHHLEVPRPAELALPLMGGSGLLGVACFTFVLNLRLKQMEVAPPLPRV